MTTRFTSEAGSFTYDVAAAAGGAVPALAATSCSNDVAYGLERAERIIGDRDVECFFDLEGDVDLVERVDVQLFKGGIEVDGIGGDVFGLGDDFDRALGDVVHDGSPLSVLWLNVTGMPEQV